LALLTAGAAPMCLIRLFTLKELEKLDEKQLALLNDAIRHEILTSDEVKKVLQKKLKPLYREWVKRRPKPGRGAQPAKGRARARKT
jgi:hypothetical protein